jgi:hypothetical protein
MGGDCPLQPPPIPVTNLSRAADLPPATATALHFMCQVAEIKKTQHKQQVELCLCLNRC